MLESTTKDISLRQIVLNCGASEFSETPNQAYFYADFWFCTHTFPAGDSNLRQFFFSADASQTP